MTPATRQRQLDRQREICRISAERNARVLADAGLTGDEEITFAGLDEQDDDRQAEIDAMTSDEVFGW